MEYFNERWLSTLQKNGIDSFEALWNLNEGDWFEEPNYRRGGWSGVCKAKISLPEKGEVNIFIKRQENHFYRSLRHFLCNRPTFEREYRNLLSFNKYNIPAPELIYFDSRKVNGKFRSILVTRELENYYPLDDEALLLSKLAISERKRIFESVAKSMRAMHARHFQHSNLYPKHIFVCQKVGDPVKSSFIDLEKTRRRLFKSIASMKDLGVLYRHAHKCSKTDRLRFFLTYRQEKKLSVVSKKMLTKITKK